MVREVALVIGLLAAVPAVAGEMSAALFQTILVSGSGSSRSHGLFAVVPSWSLLSGAIAISRFCGPMGLGSGALPSAAPTSASVAWASN